MKRISRAPRLTALLASLGALFLSGCGHLGPAHVEKTDATAADRNCLIRAMYFESNRTSRRGLLAVGTVVMNRVKSPTYPDTICAVVSQPHQFAPGVMTRAMSPAELPLVEQMADAVLAGKRNKEVGTAMYFHVAGLKIPYRVRYVTVAGGNAFYEKLPGHERDDVGIAIASAGPKPTSRASATATAIAAASQSKSSQGKSSVKQQTSVSVAANEPTGSITPVTATTQNAPAPVLAATAGPIFPGGPTGTEASAGFGLGESSVSKACQPSTAGLEQAALRCRDEAGQFSQVPKSSTR